MSSQMCLFWTFHVNRTIKYMAYWLLFLSILFLKYLYYSIHNFYNCIKEYSIFFLPNGETFSLFHLFCFCE